MNTPPSPVKLAPSILSADFGRLGDQVRQVAEAGADYIHVDVMDGHFVPNITMGPLVVSALKSVTSLPLDVHLMISEPQDFLAQFAEAGANIMTVHVEACPHLHRTIQAITALGVKAGVALNPATPLVTVEEILPLVDLVLVMTVNPGFGGQTFIEETLGKIRRLREILDNLGLRSELEVDGGITAETAPRVTAAGATVLVAGAAVFSDSKGPGRALEKLRRATGLPR